MRTVAELEAIAAEHDVDIAGLTHSVEIMDALRARLGTVDPTLQIDPMKAKDLKNSVDWGAEGEVRFKGLSRWLNEYHAIEPKLDGARVRLFMGLAGNTLNSGRRSDVTFAYIERADNFPHLRDAVVPELAGTILDAELIMPAPVFLDDKRGWTVGPLNSTMAVLNINPAEGAARQAKHGRAVLHVFDVLAVSGEPTLDLPYVERRALAAKAVEALQSVVEEPETVQFVPDFPATAEEIGRALDRGYEGVMIKRRNGKYLPGKRGDEWLKVKAMSTGDFFIVGSNPGAGRNAGKVGSLKVAYWDGKKPVLCADVRGFDDATCDELTDPETGDVRKEFVGRVLELMGQSRTKNNRIRHPHFIRWREDKTYLDCTVDQLHLFAGEPDNA